MSVKGVYIKRGTKNYFKERAITKGDKIRRTAKNVPQAKLCCII